MKTATLNNHYPKLRSFGGLRQGTLTFARHCLRTNRRCVRSVRWFIRRTRIPKTGRWWYCLALKPAKIRKHQNGVH